jgi:hypothetical protein
LQAADIVVTAQNLNDLDTASYLINIMETKLSHMTGFGFFYNYCKFSQDGLQAYARNDYEEAFKNLWKAGGANYMNLRVIEALKNLIHLRIGSYVKTGNIPKAVNLAMKTLYHFPNDADMLYNAGVLQYTALTQTGHKMNDDNNMWRELLKKLLIMKPEHRHADIAKRLLRNQDMYGELPLITGNL